MTAIGELSDNAVNILSSLQSDENISYVNVNSLIENDEKLSYYFIKHQVNSNGKKYLFDLSDVDTDKLDLVKKKMTSILGVSFDSKYLAVSSYKGSLLYSPFDTPEDSNVQNLNVAESGLSLENTDIQGSDADTTLPQIGFYISVARPIRAEECSFRSSVLSTSENGWPQGNRQFCDNKANISLVYKVTLARSLAYGVIGNGTPDAKIVRISLDESSSSGAGIHLNDKLSYSMNRATWTVLDGWITDFSTDAWAQDYKFDISASNSRAEILRKSPTNVNVNIQNRETYGFNYGVSGGAELSKDGAKAQINASAEYTENRTLVYDTADYHVRGTNSNQRNVSFVWERENYATAASIQNRNTSDVFQKEFYPVDISRVHPIGYANFVPNLDVIYKARSNETGVTEFKVSSSVNIRPIYHATYQHYIVIGSYLKFHAYENTPRNRVTEEVNFNVDWSHPVFTGGRPVNLQLGGFNSKCIDIDDNNKINTEACDKKSIDQSFIYNSVGNYVSARDTSFCLDGDNLTYLQKCSGNLSQRWNWIDNSDELQNDYTRDILFHDTETGELTLSGTSEENMSNRTLTMFTDVFYISGAIGSIAVTANELDNGQLPSGYSTIYFSTNNVDWSKNIYMPEYPQEGMTVDIRSTAELPFYLHGKELGYLDGRQVNFNDSLGFIFTNGQWEVNGELGDEINVTPNKLYKGRLPSSYETINFFTQNTDWNEHITMPSYPQDGMTVYMYSKAELPFYLHSKELGEFDNMKVKNGETHLFQYSSRDQKWIKRR